MEVTVFYLEMYEHNGQKVEPPCDGLTVVQAETPSISFYRYLYGAVGDDYHWGRCRRLSDAELAEVIHDPKVEVHVFYCHGNPAGFAELDRRQEGEIELLQFGLTKEYLGQGLGKYFLQWTIDKAWSYQPKRFWLHTCSLDHPAALPNYLKRGFVQYKEVIMEREISS